MDLTEFSLKLLDFSAFTYLFASVLFVLGLARKKPDRLSKLIGFGSLVFSVAFTAHTLGLSLRWVIAGIDRPPWTNLYESLIFFAWGLALFQVLATYKWKVPIVGIASSPLIFLLMGMSVMTQNREIDPLIPALQSNWLKIHVVFGMVSYAAFSISACLAFLHLMRRGVAQTKVAIGLVLMILLNLGIAGGQDFFYKGEFYMTRTKEVTLQDGTKKMVKDQVKEYEGGPVITKMEPVAGAKIPYILSLLFFVGSIGVLYRRSRKSLGLNNEDPDVDEAVAYGANLDTASKVMLAGGTLSIFGVIVAIIRGIQTNEALTLQSNPYLTMLLMTTLFFLISFWVIIFNYKKFLSSLPSAPRLDELGYKNILFGFPFQTLLLITGAVWAYYAWGRSWGWDPKETWALITWLAYLIYLHGKLLMGWKPVLLSVISIISFMILVFAFLGVNLVLSGLHSYGAA